MLQLSAKALLKTFDNPMPGSVDDNNPDDDAQPSDLIPFDNDNDGFDLFNKNDMDGNGWGGDDEDQDEDGEMDGDEEDEEEDEDDPMATLPAVDHEMLIEDMAAVRTMLDKV
jgi:hypothetical protein